MRLSFLLLCPALFTFFAFSALAENNAGKTPDQLEAKAAGGDAEAEFQLGKDYDIGNGVSQNYAKAREFYAKSADQGNIKALTNLASLLMQGLGGEKEPKTAFELYRRAAEKGAARAQTAYATMLQDGVVGAKDPKGAFEWFQKAAQQGEPLAQYELALIYLYGSPAVKADPSKALPLIRDLAKQGRPDAENALGYMYESGKGVPKNRQEATSWYDLSAKQGYARGEANRGRMCFDEQGYALDVVTGYMWFFLASKQGDHVGDHCLYEYRALIKPDQAALAQERAAAFKPELSNPPPNSHAKP